MIRPNNRKNECKTKKSQVVKLKSNQRKKLQMEMFDVDLMTGEMTERTEKKKFCANCDCFMKCVRTEKNRKSLSLLVVEILRNSLFDLSLWIF